MVSIEKGGVILVAADANITAADVDPTRRNPFESLLGSNWAGNRVLLNMQNAAYIDSSAIGWLMVSQKAFRDAGGAVVLYNVQPAVRQLVDVLKLTRVLPITNDEAGARKIIEKSGGAR
jgi:anti-anti-sigma factor